MRRFWAASVVMAAVAIAATGCGERASVLPVGATQPRTAAGAATGIDSWTSLRVVPCRDTGQGGPAPVSVPGSMPAFVPAEDAGLLSWYAVSRSLAVLAPQGWSCLGLYGSGGSGLTVWPSGSHPAKHGPLVGVEVTEALTGSGWAATFQIGAPLFPNLRAAAAKSPYANGLRLSPYPGEHVSSPISLSAYDAFTDTAVAYDAPGVPGTAQGSGGPYASWAEVAERPGSKQYGGQPALVAVSVTLAPGDSQLVSPILNGFFVASCWRTPSACGTDGVTTGG